MGTKYVLEACGPVVLRYIEFPNGRRIKLATREALDNYLQGDAVTRLRADHYNHFGHCTRLSRMILTPTAVVNKPNS